MDIEILTLEKEFTDKHNVKHTRIYGQKFAYLYETASLGGKIQFEVFNRFKTSKMPLFEKWSFKSDREAIDKFNSIKFEL